MKETGIVPVFFNNNVEIAQNVVKACYEGGIRAFEFTNRGDFAIEVFKELSKFVLAECPGLILGAGTILDTPTAALYIQMGANFHRVTVSEPGGRQTVQQTRDSLHPWMRKRHRDLQRAGTRL